MLLELFIEFEKSSLRKLLELSSRKRLSDPPNNWSSLSKSENKLGFFTADVVEIGFEENKSSLLSSSTWNTISFFSSALGSDFSILGLSACLLATEPSLAVNSFVKAFSTYKNGKSKLNN